MTPENNVVLDNLAAKSIPLAAAFVTFVNEKLQRLASQTAIIQDHQDNGQTWQTPREFIVACAEEFADTQRPLGVDKSRNHRIKQYRNHMRG